MLLIRLLVLLLLPGAVLAADRPYDVRYHARFEPEAGYVTASLEVEQERSRLRMLDFHAPAPRFSEFRGDGEITRDGDRLRWQVPAQGGKLRWRVRVDHERDGADDARMTDTWAVARLDDLFPPARVRTVAGAQARATLTMDGPSGWSFETRYGPAGARPVTVETAGRRFDRPLGWFAAGDLGIRRTQIGERLIAIAGPKDQDFRRMDILAFLRWTLPELAEVVPSLPSRILLVGAAEDMWRGGLSGPGSLYVHPDRPLVSGNATSTLLHELMHVATEEPPEPGDDWIVEGLSEYYSLVVLLRSGGISGQRFERAFATLREWVDDEDGELRDPSTGADTAAAVLMFRDLALELCAADASLDEVTAELFGGGRVGRKRLRRLVEEALGQPSEVLEQALDGLSR